MPALPAAPCSGDPSPSPGPPARAQLPREQAPLPVAGRSPGAVGLSRTLIFCTVLCMQLAVKSRFCWETSAKQRGFILSDGSWHRLSCWKAIKTDRNQTPWPLSSKIHKTLSYF